MKSNLFKNKNFVLSFLGALVSNVGSMFYSFAVSFFILELTNDNPVIQGAYLAVCGVTMCVVSLFGGVISDRFNKAKIMYICDYIKGAIIIISTLLLIGVFKDNTAKVIVLFVIGFASNFIAAIFSPAASALIPLIVEEKDLQTANSYYSLLNSFQSIVGILLAGILYSIIDVYSLFIIVGVLYILSGVSEMFIKYNHKKSNDKLTIKKTFTEIGEGFKYFIKNKAILVLIGSCLFLNFFLPPIFDNFIPYFIANDISHSNYLLQNIITSPELFSAIFSVMYGIGSLIAGIILTKKIINKIYKPISISLLIQSVLLILFSFVYLYSIKVGEVNYSIIGMIILSFVIGTCLVVVNVPINTMLQKTVDKNMLGKVNGVLNLASQGLVPLSAFLAGLAINYLGEFALLLICGVGFLLATLFFSTNKISKTI